MNNLQTEVFQWASQQSPLSGVAILLLGFLYGFWGLKMFPVLLALGCAGIGAALGAVVGNANDIPAAATAALGAILLGVLGGTQKRMGMVSVCLVSAAAFGAYLAIQLRLDSMALMILSGVGGLLGVLFACMCPRTMPVIWTAGVGTGLLLVAFVNLSTFVAPEIGATFRSWAASLGLLVPFLGGMVFVAAYSYQTMLQRGDMITGI
jgi:hypothetical protein